MPASVNLGDTVAGCNGPMYRNSRVRFAGVTDGLSNTIFAGEKTALLADATWGRAPRLRGLGTSGAFAPSAPTASGPGTF